MAVFLATITWAATRSIDEIGKLIARARAMRKPPPLWRFFRRREAAADTDRARARARVVNLLRNFNGALAAARIFFLFRAICDPRFQRRSTRSRSSSIYFPLTSARPSPRRDGYLRL